MKDGLNLTAEGALNFIKLGHSIVNLSKKLGSVACFNGGNLSDVEINELLALVNKCNEEFEPYTLDVVAINKDEGEG